MIAPSSDPPVIATATSTYASGVTIGYIAPTAVGITSAVCSPVRPVVDSGITTIAGCSVTSEHAPWAPTSAHPAEGTGTTMGSACLARGVVTLVPLSPKIGVAPADGCYLAWKATPFFCASAKRLRCLPTLQEMKSISHDEIHPKQRKQGN